MLENIVFLGNMFCNTLLGGGVDWSIGVMEYW